MKTRKITALIMATASFGIITLQAMPPVTFAIAEEETTPRFYMQAGASVNLDDESYGGIRWGTVIEKGYLPINDASAADVTYGTFVIPTATYNKVNKETTEISEIEGRVDIKSDVDGMTAFTEGATYTAAIKYDDILKDYETKYGDVDEATEKQILTKAYEMELTAVSYAYCNGEYIYAEATETSRSARQVANMAILTGACVEGDDKYEETSRYVGAVERTTLTNANEGYLDLSELKAETAQEIDVSAFGYDFSNVKEVLIGGKKITDTTGYTDKTGYTYADGKLSITEGSEAFRKTYDEEVATKYEYDQTWLSVFTADDKVYSLPVIPADGVIRTNADFNAFEARFGEGGEVVYGYYVLANNLTETITTTATQNNSNGSTFSEIATQVNNGTVVGFLGTLDGRGHYINKISIKHKYGIFQTLWNATIKNLAIKEVALSANTGYFAFARNVYNTKFENLYVGYTESYLSDSKYSKGFALYVRSSSFTDCVFYSKDAGKAIPSGSLFSGDRSLLDGYYGEPSSFSNTFVISERFALGASANTGDADNWTHLENTAIGTYSIKRYVSLADMMHSATYSVAEDGTVTPTESSERGETMIGNHIVAKKVVKADGSATWRILWNTITMLSETIS